MTGKRPASTEVRPNTLTDERAPNTFRVQGQAGPLPAPRQQSATGRDTGGVDEPQRVRLPLPAFRLWVWVVLGAGAAYVVYRILNG